MYNQNASGKKTLQFFFIYTSFKYISWLFACYTAPFKSAVKNVVKKEKIVGGLLASSKSKAKGGKNEKPGKENEKKPILVVFSCLLESSL
jgi:hypothetical protein